MIECVFSIYETYFREISIGFFSSILTLGFLFSFKPRIKISKKIACKSKGDSYRIKIVNKNYFFSFINIKAELQIIYSNNNPLESAKNIHLLKNYLFQITSNKICNKEYRNAYRFVSTTKIKDLIRKQGDKKGRGILGVIDGFTPVGIENKDDIAWRKKFLRDIKYKL